MFRKEFIDFVTGSGMVTLKELKDLAKDKDPDTISEFELLRFRHFDENKFARIMSEKHGLPFIDLNNAKINQDVVELLKRRQVLKFRLIPIQVKDLKVILTTYDPSAVKFAQQVGTVLQKQVDVILTNISSWRRLYESVKEDINVLAKSIVEIRGGDEPEPELKQADLENSDVVMMVNKILAESLVRGASDIHVEPYENIFRIRYRIDGSLMTVDQPNKALMPSIIARFKILAQLDISEKRRPQDGRIKLKIGGKPIDYRVSCMPTLFGEKVCLRLLDQSNLQLDMTNLGFEPDQLEVFKDGIHKPFGICLVTGPTGSGKTTTLYSALEELNTEDTNISTAEDPCEFNLEGINQVNVKKDIGLTFAAALKSFLRQDPDVIMVGEIRDFEVGEIAIEAALTGHLVLSTLHTNDAPSTVTRLLNMGIEPFLVVAALNVVVAQRLCRRICPNCRQVDTSITPRDLVTVGFAPQTAQRVKVYKGKGCEVCNQTGYKGRVAIHEVMKITPDLRELIIRGASTDELKIQAMKDGMKTLRMAALTKVAKGITTIEEAITNSASDNS